MLSRPYFLILVLFYLSSISLSLSTFLPSFRPSCLPSHSFSFLLLLSRHPTVSHDSFLHHTTGLHITFFLTILLPPLLSLSLSGSPYFTSLLFLACTIFIPPHLIPVSYLLFSAPPRPPPHPRSFLLFPSSSHFISKPTSYSHHNFLHTVAVHQDLSPELQGLFCAPNLKTFKVLPHRDRTAESRPAHKKSKSK